MQLGFARKYLIQVSHPQSQPGPNNKGTHSPRSTTCTTLPVIAHLRQHYPALAKDVITFDFSGHGSRGHAPQPRDKRWHEWVGKEVIAAATGAPPAPPGCMVVGVGHSMGGAAMVLAAAERPDLFDKLVLVEPSTLSVLT